MVQRFDFYRLFSIPRCCVRAPGRRYDCLRVAVTMLCRATAILSGLHQQVGRFTFTHVHTALTPTLTHCAA